MTRRLRAGREGNGGGITDAEAIAAVNGWRQYGYAFRGTPLTPAGATPESYLLATTPVLQPGIYQLRILFFIIGSASGTDLAADVEVDAVSQGTILTEAVVPGGGFVLTGIPDQDWTGVTSTHTIELFVAQPSSPGTVTAVTAHVSWERVA